MPCCEHSQNERGFALTEVIIASILLVLVSGAFLQLIVGSSSAQSSMKVRQKQHAVVEGLIEHLRVDSSWTDDCTQELAGGTTDKCTIDVGAKYARSPFTLDEATGQRYTISATATSVDSKADGLAPTDQTPVDFFRVTTTVSAPDGTTVAALHSTSVVDPFTGVVSGSVDLDVCQMPMQTDERAVIPDCVHDQDMDSSSVDLTDKVDYDALPADRKRMDVDPVATGTPVTLRRVLKNGLGAAITKRTDANGKLTIGRLVPGRYQVSVNEPTGMKLWKTKSIPSTVDPVTHDSTMILTVDPYQTTQGLVAFRYESAPDYHIRVESLLKGRNDQEPDIVSPGLARTVTLRLIPMPAGRAPVVTKEAAAVSTYDEESGALVTEVTVQKPIPGLYRAVIVNGSGGLERLVRYTPPVADGSPSTYQNLTHLWLPPRTKADPPGINSDGDSNPENDVSASYQGLVHQVGGGGTDDDYDKNVPVDPPVRINVPPPNVAGTCTWHTAHNLFEAGGDPDKRPGIRRSSDPQCAPCAPGIEVNHQAWDSDVTIRCEDDAHCNQSVTLTDGFGWLGYLLGGIGLHGGSVDVICYTGGSAGAPDNCTQAATVAGNRDSLFACMENSHCSQMMPQSASVFGTTGGSADVQCFTGSTCKQTGLISPGTVMTARCYPDSHCSQRIGSSIPFTIFGGSGGPVSMECYQRSTCDQWVQKTPDFLDALFGQDPTGALNILCSHDSRCDQDTSIGSFAQGFNILCYSFGSCKQSIKIGATFGYGMAARGGKARQACFINAKCDQIVNRAAPAAVLDQACFPRDGFQRDAANAVGPACNLDGRSYTIYVFFFIPVTIETAQNQLCTTAETCTETIVSGGGFFSNAGTRPMEQRCIARKDCTQRMTRMPALLGGNVGDVYQNCQTSQGKCDQAAWITDTSIFSFGGGGTYKRQQICDSGQSCKQEMYGQTGGFFESLFGTGPRNPVYQLCDRKFTPGDLDTVPNTETPGDYDPDPTSGGGA